MFLDKDNITFVKQFFDKSYFATAERLAVISTKSKFICARVIHHHHCFHELAYFPSDQPDYAHWN